MAIRVSIIEHADVSGWTISSCYPRRGIYVYHAVLYTPQPKILFISKLITGQSWLLREGRACVLVVSILTLMLEYKVGLVGPDHPDHLWTFRRLYPMAIDFGVSFHLLPAQYHLFVCSLIYRSIFEALANSEGTPSPPCPKLVCKVLYLSPSLPAIDVWFLKHTRWG